MHDSNDRKLMEKFGNFEVPGIGKAYQKPPREEKRKMAEDLDVQSCLSEIDHLPAASDYQRQLKNDACQQLIKDLLNQGQFAEAIQVLEHVESPSKATHRNRHDVMVQMIVDAQAQAGLFDEAKATLKLALRPEAVHPTTIAQCLARSGNLEEARAAIDSWGLSLPEQGEVYVAMAEHYLATGRKDEVHQLLQEVSDRNKALKLVPTLSLAVQDILVLLIKTQDAKELLESQELSRFIHIYQQDAQKRSVMNILTAEGALEVLEHVLPRLKKIPPYKLQYSQLKHGNGEQSHLLDQAEQLLAQALEDIAKEKRFFKGNKEVQGSLIRGMRPYRDVLDLPVVALRLAMKYGVGDEEGDRQREFRIGALKEGHTSEYQLAVEQTAPKMTDYGNPFYHKGRLMAGDVLQLIESGDTDKALGVAALIKEPVFRAWSLAVIGRSIPELKKRQEMFSLAVQEWERMPNSFKKDEIDPLMEEIQQELAELQAER